MHRVDTATAAASLPAAQAAGTPGFFVQGDPTTPTQATTPGADWFNMIQEELYYLVTESGLTPDATKADFTQVHEAISIMIAASAVSDYSPRPLSALPYPQVGTSDRRLTVTPASATAGGTVSISADDEISLGEEITAGETGRLRLFTTSDFTSADLDANETYYLRAKSDGSGGLTVYTTKGSDADATPSGLEGTVDGSSGGGFDSTVLDILLAKVVTGSAASTPTVTTLANAQHLRARSAVNWGNLSVTSEPDGGVNMLGSGGLSLNWARTPMLYNVAYLWREIPISSNYKGDAQPLFSGTYPDSVSGSAGTITANVDRYEVNPVASIAYGVASTTLTINITGEYLAIS